MESENVALFDMDQTLCDHNGQLARDMKALALPGDPEFTPDLKNAPKVLQERADRIRSSQEWWASLPRMQLGWDVLQVAQELGYRIMLVTKGPGRNAEAWTGKKLWRDRQLPDAAMTITEDKGLIYGKILVDDWPIYVDRWLTWRPNGLVIMPASDYNRDYSHPQVIRYDGTNLEEVKSAMRVRLNGGQELEQLFRRSQGTRIRKT